MKLLLLSPSYSPVKNTDYFPLGIGFLASYCTSRGHSVRAINFNNYNAIDHKKVLQNEIEEFTPEIVGVGGLTGAFLEIEKIIRYVREMIDIPIVIGGGVFSSEPELMMHELQVDYGIAGEGEIILGGLLDSIEKAIPLPKGLWFWNAQKLQFNGKGPVINDLDLLPNPNIDLLGVDEFFKIKQNRPYSPHLLRLDIKHDRSIPISASRSCPYRCTFCYHAGLGSYRQMSIDKLIALIKEYQKRYDTNHFSIYDELFASKRERIVEFCSKIALEQLDIIWSCQLRVDSIDSQLLGMLKESGCQFVSYGVESGSDTILKSMNKKISTKQIVEAVEMTRVAKIGIQANFLYGDPAETTQTVGESLRFQAANKLFFMDWSTVIPYPGSKIYMDCCESGKIPDKISFIRKLCNQSRYLWHDKINMTTMADDVFEAGYLQLRESNDQNHRRSLAEIVTSRILSPRISELKINCVSCHESIEFNLTYPPPSGDSFAIRSLVGISGVNLLCPYCYRKMHIKSIDIEHIRHLYREFQQKLDSFVVKKQQVVVMPAMDRLYGSFSEDIDFKGLSVVAVLDSRENHFDTTFMGCQVEELNEDSISKYSTNSFVILPWMEFEEAYKLLSENGISADSIVSWNEQFKKLQ